MPPEADVIEKPDTTPAPAAPAAPAPASGSEPAAAAPAAPASTEPAAAPAAPAGDDKKSGGSILDEIDDDSDEGDKTAEGNKEPAKDGEKKPEGNAPWRADWREAIAGGDEKRLAALKRFATPEAMAKSYFALQQKLSSGEYKKAPGEDASPEELAAWRQEQGIPETPDKYELPPVERYEWSDADKAAAAPLLERLHGKNVPQAAVNEMMGWYAEAQAKHAERIAEIDGSDKQTVEEHMRSAWGDDFKPNTKLLGRLFKDADVIPPALRDALVSARTPDGRRISNMPETIDFLASIARDRYGDGGMLYGDAKVEVSNELKEIEKIRDTDIDKYYREGHHIKYAELLKKTGGKQ